MKLRHWVLVLLAAAALAQLGAKLRVEQPEVSRRIPLLTGDEMPVQWLASASTPGTLPGGCWQGFFVSPKCPACRSLAERLGGDGAYVGYWIVEGPPDQGRLFIDSYGISEGKSLWFLRGGAPVSFADAGVFGVPMRVIVRADGRVADIRLTHAPADAEAVEAACGR